MKIYLVWGDGCDYFVVDSVFANKAVAEMRASDLNADGTYPSQALSLDWSVEEMEVRWTLDHLIHPDDIERDNGSWFINP